MEIPAPLNHNLSVSDEETHAIKQFATNFSRWKKGAAHAYCAWQLLIFQYKLTID